MSEIIWQDDESRISISKFTGPEQPDGGPRVMVQIMKDFQILQLSVADMLTLSSGFWTLIHASDQLPMCLDVRCAHGPPPHGKWHDCPKIGGWNPDDHR